MVEVGNGFRKHSMALDSTARIQLPIRYYRLAKTALELANISDNDMAHSLCALVVRKNRVLSIGYNSRKTHTIMNNSHMKMLHAECDALLRCGNTEGVEMIVARSKPSGKPGLAKPCEVCERILRQFGIRKVFYTVNCETLDDIQLEKMKL